jgi:putative transposase
MVDGGADGCRQERSRQWSHGSRSSVLPRRWVVERTLAWLGRFRRLSKDHEFLPATSEAVIHLATIQLLVRRLASK